MLKRSTGHTLRHSAVRLLLLLMLPAWCLAARDPAPNMLNDKEARLRDLTAQWPGKPQRCLWNFHNLYNPDVVYDAQSDYPFKMFFFGWAAKEYNEGLNAKSDAIFHARARDLKTWEVYAGKEGWDKTMNPKLWVPVVSADNHPTFDSEGNGDPSVVLKDGQYHMAFSSIGFDIQHNPKGEHIYLVNNVMGAISKDGIHWTKTVRPIAIWNQEYVNRWELIPGQGVSPAPPNFYGSYHRPSLMFDEGKWKLWFDYFHPDTFVSLGYAENTGDFTTPADWKIVRSGKSPLLKDWPNPAVVKAGKLYYAFCDAPYYPEEWGGDTRQITMASSKDGIHWTVLGHIRPEGKASSHVAQALVLKEGNDTWLYLFYSWKPERKPGQASDFRYKEIRYIKRKVSPGELGQ